MPLSIVPEADHASRYAAPEWARRMWGDPKLDAVLRDVSALPDADEIKRDADPILFVVADAPAPAIESVWTRLSAAFGYAVACAAILYFFGHVIAAWAMGRL